MALMLTALLGCPWITPAEHDANRKDLDGDADTDTDADADTDTGGGCVEDAFEENDSPTAPSVVSLLPANLAGQLCVADPDHFTAAVADDLNVFRATVDADEPVVLRVWYEGTLFETATGRAPEIRLGMGAGNYLVGVRSPDDGETAYDLSLAQETCFDNDGDHQADVLCGGADCNDAAGDVYRGAEDVPANGIDEDCDGLDDLESAAGCNPKLNDTVSTGTLACGEPDYEPVWDHYILTGVPGGVPLEIYLNPVGAPADLFALYLENDGRYGLDVGELELDGEVACDPASLGQCPGACLTGSGGVTNLWVAQRNCTGPVDYELRLGSSGGDPTLSLVSGVAAPR